MASSWPTKRLYEQPESATAAVRAITTTEALRTSPVIVVSIDGRPEGRPLPSNRDHSIRFTIHDSRLALPCGATAAAAAAAAAKSPEAAAESAAAESTTTESTAAKPAAERS